MTARASVVTLCLSTLWMPGLPGIAAAGTFGKTTLGSTNYPMGQVDQLPLYNIAYPPACAVVLENQAYVVTTRGQIIQVDLETLRRVRSIETLPSYLSPTILCASIGETGYFLAYDGSGSAEIDRVDLKTLTVVGHLSIEIGQGPVETFSAAGGALYLGLSTDPVKIIKVNPDQPDETTTLTMEPDENSPLSVLFDDGFAYVGVRVVDKGRIVKVDLADFTRVDAIDLEVGETPKGAALAADEAAYFAASFTQYLSLVKVDLIQFRRVGALQIDTGAAGYADAETGTIANGAALFGVVTGNVFDSEPSTGSILRINLDDFTLAESPPIGSDRRPAGFAFEAGGSIYLGTSKQSEYRVTLAEIVRYDATTFQQTATLNLNPGEDTLSCGFRVGDQAYFGGATVPGHIVQVDLSHSTRVGSLDLQIDEQVLGTAVEADGFGYFGSYFGKVVKVDLSNLTRVAALQLDPEETAFTTALASNGFAYFTPAGTSGKVVKIELGGFTRVGSILLRDRIVSAVRVRNDGYYALQGGTIVRVDLESFTETGRLRLRGETLSQRAVASGSFGYFLGEQQGRAALIKVDLRHLTRVESVTFDPRDGVFSGGMATDGRSAMLSTSAGRILRVDLKSMKLNGVLKALDAYPQPAVVADAAAAYFAATPNPYSTFGEGVLLKASFGSPRGAIHATRADLRRAVTPRSVSFYAHEAGVTVRLAIYDFRKTLLWESPAVRVRRPDSLLTVLISRGTPGLTRLHAGRYYLAWQVDSNKATPSYKRGEAGTGWSLSQPFGPFPARVSGGQVTDESWTEFVSF